MVQDETVTWSASEAAGSEERAHEVLEIQANRPGAALKMDLGLQ